MSEQDIDTSIINVRIVSSAGISEPVDIFMGDGKISGIHKSGVRKAAGNSTDGKYHNICI